MTLFGVRPSVWLALAASAVAAVLGPDWAAARHESGAPSGARARPTSARPERAARTEAGRGTRIRVGSLELARDATRRTSGFEGSVTNAWARPAGPVAAAGAAHGDATASPRVAHEGVGTSAERGRWVGSPPPRPGAVVSLERAALRSVSALPREDAETLAADVDARVAELAPEPDESRGGFEARLEDARGRRVSDELLLRARLAELYAQQVYPPDFDFEHLEQMERQLIEQLPAVDRAEALRRLAEAGPPGRPQPRFEGDPVDEGDASDL